MTRKYTHESIPTQVVAVQLTADLGETVDRIRAVFGGAALDQLRLSFDLGVVRAEMKTIQDRFANASTGEWLIQEQANLGRFYPCAADVFAVRYRSL